MALRQCLDEPRGRYQELRGVRTFDAYVRAPAIRSDEEMLTEPILAAIMERVLGFPPDSYFPQLGRGGIKPDFTPIDLIAHSFVLDAKSSEHELSPHEPQIRNYIDQRSLDYGILFNLREVRTYRRGGTEHDPALSFAVLPLWHLARGEALPAQELSAFAAFCDRFAHRDMGMAQKIEHIRSQESWAVRFRSRPRDPVRVDVEFLTERLRSLARDLVDDARAQMDRLDEVLALQPARERLLRRELEALALDVSPGADLTTLPQTVAEWRSHDGLAERVWRQYLLRVAYLSLTRILLYRAWEDVEFVDDYLYDGGFGTAYDRLSDNVQRVLDEAFHRGADRYHWLFGADNNYDWFRPREAVLVDVLYSLAPVPLGKLDADVLGDLYASYVDEIDRDRLGQFYTPRSVVRFMLDCAGFHGPEGVFHIEGDVRRPRRVFDFATGSGGFLVEAARRIVDEGGIADDDVRGLREALAATVTGLVGGEISPFPYYLTEVNLLLQVSRLLGRLNLAGDQPATFALSVLHIDSLLARAPFDESLEGIDSSHRADRGGLVVDERFGLVPLDGDKQEAFRALRDEGRFDLVIGNPPYVGEANNKPLFDRLRAIPAWTGTYRGKTDYLYYFLILAAEKVAPGGRLCVITPAGWMNAGAADFLRERLADQLRLDELFLFGSHRLFAPLETQASRRRVPTPTVESAILLATKGKAPASHSLRIVALEDEAAAAVALSDDPQATTPDRDLLLKEMARRMKGRPGRKNGIHALRLKQSSLDADRPWPVKTSATDTSARVVAHLQSALDRSAGAVEPLAQSWNVFSGIETGADAYTRRIDKRLTPDDRRTLAGEGLTLGDPILQLPPGRELGAPWREFPELVVRAPEGRAILYGTIDKEDYVGVVMLDATEPPPAVLQHLTPWRLVLESRAEIARNTRRRWWETAWRRDAEALSSPKVIALHRTDRGRFALDEDGAWQPTKSATAIVGRSSGAPVAYLCGLLNSELLDLWYSVRGRSPRDVWRDYEPRPMNQIPYRRPKGDPRCEEIAVLVRRVAENRRAVLLRRTLFPRLTSIVKDPWRAETPAIEPAAAISALPSAQTISVRLDSRLESHIGEPPRGKPTRPEPGAIVFRRARVVTGRIGGPTELLDVLEVLLGTADNPAAVLLPKDLVAYQALVISRTAEVGALLAEGRRLVEQIERLVCGLYDVPDDLADEVVAHALARAGWAADDSVDDGP